MFTEEDLKSLRDNESGKTSETFFSTKEGDNFFDSFNEHPISVVGLQPVGAENGVGAHNRVLFSDGHMMSSSKFFAARGLQWPVGGSLNKLNYLVECIEKGIKLDVTPDHVVLGVPYLVSKTTLPKNATVAARTQAREKASQATKDWRAIWDKENATEKELKVKNTAPEGWNIVTPATYYFEPAIFPALTATEEESA